jgi:hypothetical protein
MKERLVWALALAGCTDPHPPSDLPPLEGKGDHVEFGSDLVDEVCLGTLELLDRDVEAIEAVFELEPEPDPIRVWVLSNISDHCADWALGCSTRAGIFIGGPNFAVHRHELVHGRLARVRGDVKPLIEEGIASELGGSRVACNSYETCANANLEPLLTATNSEELTALGYHAGADLIHGLLLADGGPAVLAFSAEVDRDMSADEVRAKYTEHFGRSIDLDFEDYKRGVLDDFNPASVDCTAPLAPRTDRGGIVLEAEMECDSPDVVNDFTAANEGERDRGVVEWTVMLEPEDAGAFVLTGAIDLESELLVRACMPQRLVAPWSRSGPPSPADPLLLGPTWYRITWKAPLDVGATLDAVLEPPCIFEAQDCPAGQQCTIWNLCEPEVAQPAALGEACEQALGDPRVCSAGTRCMGGICVAECDASLPCPEGEGCARIRVCGPPCNLLAQDCAAGFNCLPSEDPHAVQAGQGQCVAAGDTTALEACDPREGACSAGSSCESDPGGISRCMPYCDPTLADPSCPNDAPDCFPYFEGVAGTCR